MSTEPRKGDKFWDERRTNTPGLQPNGVIIRVLPDEVIVKFFDEKWGKDTEVSYSKDDLDTIAFYSSPSLGWQIFI